MSDTCDITRYSVETTTASVDPAYLELYVEGPTIPFWREIEGESDK